jgi:sortase A
MRKLVIILSLVVAAGATYGWWYLNNRPLPPAPALPQPKPETYQRGEPIGEVEIPRLGLNVPVFEGDDAGILELGAGHVPGTALPGHAGNICIAAHRDTQFRPLRFIHPDDEIVLQTAQGESRFRVESTTIVKPTDTQVLLPAPGRDLTLVTCYPFFYVGSAPKRFIVHAVRENNG